MHERDVHAVSRRRARLLRELDAWLEPFMFVLALVWLALLVIELGRGLTPGLTRAASAIWAVFVVDFAVKIALAPRKLDYIRANWLTLVAIALPALRVFRIARVLRVLRIGRAASTSRFVRVVTSGNRLVNAIRRAQGPVPSAEMNVGLLVSHTPAADRDALLAFAARLAQDTSPELERASGIPWRFHVVEPRRLETDAARTPPQFLDDASLAMVEGPYDIVVVITDAALLSRRRRVEPGLASEVAHVAVLSTRKLVATPRGAPPRPLDAPSVRTNAAALLLHLIGHVAGLEHAATAGMMTPFAVEERRVATRFNAAERRALRERAGTLPERELRDARVLPSLIFHAVMAARHPLDILRPLVANRAPLLPLAMPGLATAAVAPTFLLLFTAEIWDAGLNMPPLVAALYALASILGATVYLLWAQALFLPRKEKGVITEHLAVANTVIFCSMLLAVIGLFVMVAALMLVLEIYIFPEGLMATWPTLERPAVTFADNVRLAVFIATIGVTTGALAGGLESRALIQHLALFRAEV